MRYVPFFLILFACSNDMPSQETLTGKLKFLQQRRDSLAKIKKSKQAVLFEQEIATPEHKLAGDTAYISLQKSLNNLQTEIDQVESAIESTEEEIYKPQ